MMLVCTTLCALLFSCIFVLAIYLILGEMPEEMATFLLTFTKSLTFVVKSLKHLNNCDKRNHVWELHSIFLELLTDYTKNMLLSRTLWKCFLLTYLYDKRIYLNPRIETPYSTGSSWRPLFIAYIYSVSSSKCSLI